MIKMKKKTTWNIVLLCKTSLEDKHDAQIYTYKFTT